MPSPRGRLPGHTTALILLAFLTTLLVSPTAAAAAPGQVGTTAAFPAYAMFNVPSEEAYRDYTIQNEVIRLADGVPAGGYIRAVMFSWSVTDVADALQRAAERGVVVRVVLDGQLTDDTSPAIATLRSAPLDDLVFCGTSSATVSGSTACVANYGTSINHNKIFTFSTSGSWKRVVMVTSQNMTYTQDNLFNNAVVVHEDYDLYDHYTAYFNDLRAERKNNDYYHDSVNGYHKSPNTAVTSYHSPASSGDIVDGVLSYFSAYQSGCTTDVAEAMFTAGRQAVADELLRIARMGCKVRVVYSSMDKAIRDTLIQSGNVSLKKYDDGETSNYDGRRVAIHSKYLIVHGNYNGTAGRTIVFTGSHNLSRSALVYNDETVVKIEHPDVSAGFQDNFATLWSRAKCVSPESGSCLY